MPTLGPPTPGEIRQFRERLKWSAAKLADKLGVTPLTVHRWERPRVPQTPQGSTGRGRPAGAPEFLRLALDQLLLQEAGSTSVESISVALPRALGSLLPWRAREIAGTLGVRLEVINVQTGNEALAEISAGRAMVAGAAHGLLDSFRGIVTDLGTVMRSTNALHLVFFGRNGRTLTDADLRRARIIYPDGSDVGNVWSSFIRTLPQSNRATRSGAEGVSLELAQLELVDDARRQSRRTGAESGPVYIAWEPFASTIVAELTSRSSPAQGYEWRNQPLSVKQAPEGLTYQFHAVCSQRWAETRPALALALMVALAKAERDVTSRPIVAMKSLWAEYGHPLRSDFDCLQDLRAHDFQYEPSSRILQLLPIDRLAIVDRSDLQASAHSIS